MTRQCTLRCETQADVPRLAELFALFRDHRVNIRKLVLMDCLRGSEEPCSLEIQFVVPEESPLFLDALQTRLSDAALWRKTQLSTDL